MNPRPYLKSATIKDEGKADWSSYPFSIPAVSGLTSLDFHQDVTFFVGENGSGKSTILEAIALALGFSEEGGTKNVRLNTASTSSSLTAHLKLVRSFKKPKDGYFFSIGKFLQCCFVYGRGRVFGRIWRKVYPCEIAW